MSEKPYTWAQLKELVLNAQPVFDQVITAASDVTNVEFQELMYLFPHGDPRRIEAEYVDQSANVIHITVS